MFTEKQWEEARKNNMDKAYNQRRERIATALLAGMLANKNAINEYECVMVKRAISGADALIKALDEGQKGASDETNQRSEQRLENCLGAAVYLRTRQGGTD